MRKTVTRKWFLTQKELLEAVVAWLKSKDELVSDQAYFDHEQVIPAALMVCDTNETDTEPTSHSNDRERQ